MRWKRLLSTSPRADLESAGGPGSWALLDPAGAGRLSLDGIEDTFRCSFPAAEPAAAAAAALMLRRLDSAGVGAVTQGQFARHVRRMTAARSHLRPNWGTHTY